MSAPQRFGDHLVDDPKTPQVVTGQTEPLRSFLGLAGITPQNRRAAFRRGDGIGTVLEHHHVIGERQRQGPPLPPSPITVETIGTGARANAARHEAIASDWARSSEPIPGSAPGVSTNVTIGRRRRPASSTSRFTLRYPSGEGIPKLRRTFSLVSRPFSWAITMMRRPDSFANPPTIAGSSR